MQDGRHPDGLVNSLHRKAHPGLAKLLWSPFRLLTTVPKQVPSLLSAYRGTPFSIQDAKSEWKGDGGILFAVRDDALVGLLRMDKRRTHWVLSSFVVNPMFRGHGVGTTMIEAVAGLADPIWLQVKQDNPAQFLYRRYGFEDQCVSNGRILMRLPSNEQSSRQILC